jgi:hypothetical protein
MYLFIIFTFIIIYIFNIWLSGPMEHIPFVTYF